MNDLLVVFAYAVPFLIAAGLALGFVAVGASVLSAPRLAVYPFLAVMLLVTGNSYGALEATRSIYSRGAGVLFFSLMSWALLCAWLWVKVANGFARERAAQCNLTAWFAAWVLLIIGNVLVGALLGVSIEDSLSPSGLSNLVWMILLVLLLLNGFRTTSTLKELSKFVLLLGLGRALFGLVRWAAFGGDPANAYANRHGLHLKLTFFDINDNLVCCLALVIAVLHLARRSDLAKDVFWRAICWAVVVVAPLCIVLSFRRTAWIGVVLAGMFVLIFVPRFVRWLIVGFGAPIALVGIAYAASKRLSETKGATGLSSFFFEFQSSGIGPISARALELQLAWADIVKHPLLGLGTWGGYSGARLISWQEGAGGTFLHSGVLHVAMKSGLLGTLILFGMLFAFGSFCWRRRSSLTEEQIPLFVAGASGMLFMVPDLLIGTPIPQLRTMLMYGLCLALPYVAAGARQAGAVTSARPMPVPGPAATA